MKLADIKGDKAADVLVELIDPLLNIAEDKDAADIFQRRQIPDGMDIRGFILSRIRKSVPVLLKNHRNDIIKIIAVIREEPESSVRDNMTVPSLINDLAEIMTDDLLRAFFRSAQIEPTSSASALKNTEGTEESRES